MFLTHCPAQGVSAAIDQPVQPTPSATAVAPTTTATVASVHPSMSRIHARIQQLSTRTQANSNKTVVFQRFILDGAFFAFTIAGNTWALRSVLSG